MVQPAFNIPDFEGKTILIVEDDLPTYTFLQEEILQTKALVMWTSSGTEAIKICRKNSSIDLVLMDIKLAEGDGYSATRQIKSFRPRLPIITQTAYALVGQKELLFQSGCDNYLKKPFQTKMLYKMLSKYLMVPGTN